MLGVRRNYENVAYNLNEILTLNIEKWSTDGGKSGTEGEKAQGEKGKGPPAQDCGVKLLYLRGKRALGR